MKKLDEIVEQLSRLKDTGLMDNLQEAVVITDDSGYIRFFNSPFERLLGFQSELDEPLGKNLFNNYPFEAGDQKFMLLEQAILIGQDKVSSWVKYTAPKGDEMYFNIKISPLADKSGTQIVLTDVTREVQSAIIDELTGAYSHSYYLRDLKRLAIAQAHRTKGYLGTIGVDLKGLKRANDTRGMKAGDTLLKETVKILMASVRGTDYVVRRGGDEFIVLCPGADQTAIDKIVERIDVKTSEYNKGIEDTALHLTLYKVGGSCDVRVSGGYDQLFAMIFEKIGQQKRR